MKPLILYIVTFCGVGLIPVAPGTCGSLTGWLFFEIVVKKIISPIFAVPFILVVAFLSIRLFRSYFPSEKDNDPPKIVIDEVGGIWLALALVPDSFVAQLAVFFAFRFFDVIKPLGIRFVEKLPNYALAIILDDTLAAIYAAIVVNLAGIIF